MQVGDKGVDGVGGRTYGRERAELLGLPVPPDGLVGEARMPGGRVGPGASILPAFDGCES